MSFEGRLWQLGNVITLAVVLLSARIVYWIVVRADDLRPVVVSAAAAEAYAKMLQGDRVDTAQALSLLRGESAFGQLPQPVIQRSIDLLNTITRGSIYDRNGHKLAFDQQAADGTRTRVYSEPSLAHVIGYVSGIRAGITGLELTYNSSLLGLDRLDAQFDQSTHQPIAGSSLTLTVDTGLQRAADQALAGQAGAAVILDASTGAVLAMASQPGFDPNQILDQSYATKLLAGCGAAPQCQGALLNRATQGLYAPGSTFKTITLIAGLDTGQVSPATVFDFGQRYSGPNGPYYVYTVDGANIPDPNHVESKLNLEMSYALSANDAFARMGNEMPAAVLIDYAGRFGFSAPNSKVRTTELPMASPQLAGDVKQLAANNYLRATTAFGQGEILADPLTMAMVVMAVVNHGNLPLPYLVEAIRDPQGKTIQQAPARGIVMNLMKPATADLVRGMMITAAVKGSGKPALVQGLTIGGKTGTAQVGGSSSPHAWFIGFAQGKGRTVVIAVVVENAGEGHDVAAPIFARLADAAINHLGEPVQPLTPTTAVSAGANPAGGPPAPDIPVDPHENLNILAEHAACALAPAAPKGSGHFSWPVDPQFRRLVGEDFKPGHPGIDLGAPTGAPIYAADTGQVVFASWSDLGYGNAVVIDHGNGYQTLYAHLSQLQTFCGAMVRPGAVIGLAGATGNAFGPHLHFEIRVPGGFLNPWKNLPPP